MGKLGSRWGTKTREDHRARARERYHEQMKGMTDAEKLVYRKAKSTYAKGWRDRVADTPQHDKMMLKKKEYYHANIGIIKTRSKTFKLKDEYGLTPEQYAEMVTAQAGRCYLCAETAKRLVIDHNHKTGKVRKLLCDKCNIAIAGLENIVQRVDFQDLAAYLHTGLPDHHPGFTGILKRMQEIHAKKAADYTGDDPFGNFKDAAYIAGTSVDKVFRTLIGVKLARLSQLIDSDKVPMNESVDDSLIDLATYSTLWATYRKVI